jgi:cytochrome P450
MDAPGLSSSTAAASPLGAVAGPRGWPLLGNLPQLDPQRMHLQLERWSREHGPVYRIRMGRRDALVVARPDLLSRILRDRPDGWRRLQAIQAVAREVGAHGVFSAEGEDWRRQRRLVMGAFDPGHLKRLLPIARGATPSGLAPAAFFFSLRRPRSTTRRIVPAVPMLMRYNGRT